MKNGRSGNVNDDRKRREDPVSSGLSRPRIFLSPDDKNYDQRGNSDIDCQHENQC